MALTDVTFPIGVGEIVGLAGPNGAGKTTMLRVLAGLVAPGSGRVEYGFVPHRNSVRYFGGDRTLPPDVRANAWHKAVTGRPAAEQRPFGQLSRGTRQRFGLEAVLSPPDPDLLLLDEPWDSLDPDASRWLTAQLHIRRQHGVSTVVSSHRLHELASTCDRCVFLMNGRITLTPDRHDAAELFRTFDRLKGAS